MPSPNDSTGATHAGALRSLYRPTASQDLRRVTLAELSAELLARLEAGKAYEGTEELLLGEQLSQLLDDRLDVHLNRFSAARHRDLLEPILERLRPGDLRDTTVVDLGCGSLNPFAFAFLLLMLGAGRAHTVDPEPVQSMPVALRALPRVAAWLLLEPGRVLGSYVVPVEELLGNLRGFRLPLLAAGDPAGLPADRLVHHVESVTDLSLEDGEADFVFSVSLLEHLDRIDDAIAALHRITRPGGRGVHVVDFVDHRIYSGEVESPFELLKIRSDEPLVHGSNRLRCSQLCARFEAHGFVVEHAQRWRHGRPLADDEPARFVEPFRFMDVEDLATTGARLFVRRA